MCSARVGSNPILVEENDSFYLLFTQCFLNTQSQLSKLS
uniref:Uncharacterized protein n=1 Tax=Anopheles dirus TaxID=7168 RepID=A0A182NYG6_9DIPT